MGGHGGTWRIVKSSMQSSFKVSKTKLIENIFRNDPGLGQYQYDQCVR